MANQIETLQTIRAWARSTFPDSYSKFDNFSRINKSTYCIIKGRIISGHQVTKPEILTAIPVSSLSDVWA